MEIPFPVFSIRVSFTRENSFAAHAVAGGKRRGVSIRAVPQ
jgi:hypothetical protein